MVIVNTVVNQKSVIEIIIGFFNAKVVIVVFYRNCIELTGVLKLETTEWRQWKSFLANRAIGVGNIRLVHLH